jgi:hypothetical protein
MFGGVIDASVDVVKMNKSIYDNNVVVQYEKDGWIHRIAVPNTRVVVEFAKDGWVHRIAVEPSDFDPSEDPIGRG